MSHSTFVFADLAGFTALTEASTPRMRLPTSAGAAREILGSDGELIKTIGDAVMVRCPAAQAAVATSVT